MSQPHFYEGPRYSAAIEGMHPQKDEHQTFFDVEPVSHDRTFTNVLYVFSGITSAKRSVMFL